MDETVLQYIAAIRDLATTCEFAETLDDILHDQLVESVASLLIWERILVEAKLTLETAISIPTQLEAANAQTNAMASSTSSPVQDVQSNFAQLVLDNFFISGSQTLE